jgi:hypothetical protein
VVLVTAVAILWYCLYPAVKREKGVKAEEDLVGGIEVRECLRENRVEQTEQHLHPDHCIVIH